MNAFIKDFSRQEICKLMGDLGYHSYRGNQIFTWLYKGINSFDAMTNIPKMLKYMLKQKYVLNSISILEKLNSAKDDTIKFLFELYDGNIIEAVLMHYKHGYTACISTQVGCLMGCTFCASGISGKIRNLSPGEMVDQVLTIQHQINDKKISNIVLMGSGEPFDNYDNVIKFIQIIHDRQGLNIGMRNITISTCGLVDGIYKLSRQNMPVNLSISLHAPNDELRNKLMPINKKYNIKAVLDACREYIKRTHRRVTIEYILIDNINDSKYHARQLSDLLRGDLFHVNLIPINAVKERSFRKPNVRKVNEFKKVLEQQLMPVTIRRELGSDIDAACGQLRRRFINNTLRG